MVSKHGRFCPLNVSLVHSAVHFAVDSGRFFLVKSFYVNCSVAEFFPGKLSDGVKCKAPCTVVWTGYDAI